jgi:hypothetical protein
MDDEVWQVALRIAKAEKAKRPPAPWRMVTQATLEEGTSNMLNAAQSRTGRSWGLRLSCGHETFRDVTYTPHPQRGQHRQRSYLDLKPAPTRVRCSQCRKTQEKS